MEAKNIFSEYRGLVEVVGLCLDGGNWQIRLSFDVVVVEGEGSLHEQITGRNVAWSRGTLGSAIQALRTLF